MYLLFYKDCSSNCYFYSNLLDLYKDWALKNNKLLFKKKNYRKNICIVKIPSEKISTQFLLSDFEPCELYFRKSDKKCLK